MILNNSNLYGEGGNQRLRPNVVSNNTSDTLVTPVTPTELADFLSIDYNDADENLYIGFLLAATDQCIKYTNIELLERTYTLKTDYYPQRQAGFAGVGMMHAYRSWWINLPLYPVQSVTSVTVNEVAAVDPIIDLSSRPARVEPTEMGAIEIQYVAGHATPFEINPQLLLGITMLAAYLYEHRGACDVGNAVKSSGAAMLWDSARMIKSL